MKTWQLVNIVTGSFAVRCDDCGSFCRRRYSVIRNRETGETRNVGSDCGFRRTGMREPIRVYDDGPAEVGDMPGWMM